MKSKHQRSQENDPIVDFENTILGRFEDTIKTKCTVELIEG